MKKIYLDFDGVLCNSLDLWEEWIGKTFNTRNVKSEYWSDMTDRYGDLALIFWKEGSNVYELSDPFDYATNFVDSLLQYDLKIITRTFPGMHNEKVKWFQRYLPQINPVNIISVNGNKNSYTVGGILIDDGFHNIADHVSHNSCPGILFNYQNKYPHASMFRSNCDYHNIYYCMNYTEVLYQIKQI